MAQFLKTLFYPGYWIYGLFESAYGDGDTENNTPRNAGVWPLVITVGLAFLGWKLYQMLKKPKRK